MSRQAALLAIQHAREHASLDARLLRPAKPRAEQAYLDQGGTAYREAYEMTYKRTYRAIVGRGWVRKGRVEGVAHGKEDAASGRQETLRPNGLRSVLSPGYYAAYRESYRLAHSIEQRVQQDLLYRQELKARLTTETRLNTRELRALELQQQKDQLRAKAQRDLGR